MLISSEGDGALDLTVYRQVDDVFPHPDQPSGELGCEPVSPSGDVLIQLTP
jgi:hypothetical protein